MLNSKYRFHRRNHVNRVHKQGKSGRSGALSIRYRIAEGGDQTKFAVVVSKKVAKSAVVRNRIRRRVFEVIRAEQPNLQPGLEAVIGVYDASVADMPFAELKKTVHSLLAQVQSK
jgi:ribonuclease P protein component